MKEGKKGLPISVTDFVIIALIAVLCFFVYKYVFSAPPEETYNIDYVVKVSEIRSELSDRISVGDLVYGENGAFMGRVTATSAVAAVKGSTGKTIPDRTDLYITIEADADSDGEVAGHRIYAEREMELYTPGLYFNGVCISVWN